MTTLKTKLDQLPADRYAKVRHKADQLIEEHEMRQTAINLNKLADYLEANVPQDKLSMEMYRFAEDGEYVWFKGLDDCGTSGCALGWAPFVKGLETLDEDFTSNDSHSDLHLDWQRYGDRIFNAHQPLKVLEWDSVYDTCFDEKLSSEKSKVVARLRNTADKLDE